MKLCFYACTVFACIGYREVNMHGAVLGTTGLRLSSFPDRHGEERDQRAVYRLFPCSAQLAA